ncbi:hypothetical protein PAAG_05713 [Paracoccidioides lutzii Pb01]|uniref:Uncharacterized protein n=1 Tax=Paracoccidioides lutzii (strain ATCC MYA-826 / Pb01) TaxID=502779 RepID=C1H4M0_PARBA|nr:hypothetical protein PAAG_05713 [Paracoccidioides lutzii Pb01]EEH34664.2 hypothetical protein PAAG_05713 [Paracoccidioides lutzii Pb01]
MNGAVTGNGDGSSLRRFYSYKNTFDENSVWLEIPKQITFSENSDPFVEEYDRPIASTSDPAANPQPLTWDANDNYRHQSSLDAQTQGLEALSEAVTGGPYHHLRPNSSPPVHPSTSRNDIVSNLANNTASSQTELPAPLALTVSVNPTRPSMPAPTFSSASTSSPNNNINFILNPSTSMFSPIDPNLQSSPPHSKMALSASTPSGSKELISGLGAEVGVDVESDRKIAFLLHHFSEAPGQWQLIFFRMDLFDFGEYFASYVPVKAITEPLLKYAACAYEAKQLGRVKGKKAIIGGICGRQSTMEVWPDAEKIDWYYHGAKYYDKAIQLLMEVLHPEPELCSDSSRSQKRQEYPNSCLSSTHSDEVLAAAAILSVGDKSLLDIAEAGMMPVEQLGLAGAQKLGLSKARKATFWSFARQDYLSAFINQCQTRLNTEDLFLWTEAGLLLDNAGFVRPSNTTGSAYPEGDAMKEDLISNALIWILSKVVNFIATGNNLSSTKNVHAESSSIGVWRQTAFEGWDRLQTELGRWYNGLPNTFKPCVRLESSYPSFQDPNEAPLPCQEVWYILPMCGSTMQHYHMKSPASIGRSQLFRRATYVPARQPPPPSCIQELNTLKQHLETLQSSRNPHEMMDWEPIPPADTHHQQQQEQGQPRWKILDMSDSAS